MNKQAANQETNKSGTDSLKWLSVLLIIVAGVALDMYFASTALSLRIIGWIVCAAIAGFIGFRTQKGRVALSFMRESRIEMRKVVWPTRQETVQTTGVIMVMVLIVGCLLWLLDTGLIYAIGLITNK